ncbi:hypothetical protein C4K68_09105 [Pokkaliibacter plantistimulans]|uniref:GGDEF domain-containing protein n=1 Tax=Proteobacteria bacterium 228 TaxID=2083153 RepID=A0A2S5KSW8_9PROT|nr:EAL domain-containing protein [Pokkaliibacter plantistimulans]PPC77629.1 hypothetical protein C4K68_09105 [Pokkaliibacter plantistimulans]
MPKASPPYRSALTIAISYALLSTLWILFSDTLVQQWSTDSDAAMNLQRYKGLLFVLISALYLFYVSLRFLRDLDHSRKRLGSYAIKLDNLLQRLPEGLFEVSSEGKVLLHNRHLSTLLALGEEDLHGHSIWPLLPECDATDYLRDKVSHLLSGAPTLPRPVLLPMPDQRILELTWGPLQDASQQLSGWFGVIVDISARVRQQDQLTLHASVFDNASEGHLICTEEGRILAANSACQTLLEADEPLLGQAVSPLIAASWPSFSALLREVGGVGEWQGECELEPLNHQRLPVNLRLRQIELSQISGYCYLLTFSDLRTLKQSEQRISRLTQYDPLTGLPNRQQLEQFMATYLRAETGTSCTLCYLEIDRYRQLRDNLGPQAGNQLVRIMARRLSNALSDDDLLFRYGDDDFIVLLRFVGDSEEQVIKRAEALRLCSLHPISLQGMDVHLSLSQGLSRFPQDGDSLDSLLQKAMLAQSQVRAEGGNGYYLYNLSRSHEAMTPIRLENDLRQSIGTDELYPVFQPQVDMCTGAVTGMELLARWRHPQDGPVPPLRFIPLAEESELIDQISIHLLRKAIAYWPAWQAISPAPMTLSFNLAPALLLRDAFLHFLNEEQENGRISPQWLRFEITENRFIDDSAVLARLYHLNRQGYAIIMDDFGTGYSSLGRLKDLPLQALKIDRTFVHDALQSTNDQAIIISTLSLATHLGLDVIAEGVETTEQAEWLRQQGCPKAQGYLFSAPLPADQLGSYLQQQLRLNPSCAQPE